VHHQSLNTGKFESMIFVCLLNDIYDDLILLQRKRRKGNCWAERRVCGRSVSQLTH